VNELATLVIGAGPGGVGPLAWAARHGMLAPWCRRGLLLADAGSEVGSVALGRYRLRADSSASSFLEGMHGEGLGELDTSASLRALAQLGDDHPPLALASCALGVLGARIAMAIPRFGGTVLPKTRLLALRLRKDGGVEARLRHAGATQVVNARTVVLALGGRMSALPRIRNALPASLRDRPLCTSDWLLRRRPRELTSLLGRRRPRVTVVGGSHSAFSVAWRLLRAHEGVEVHLVHRGPLRVCYASERAARDDHFDAFDEDDVCPATGRVHRLGGLRGDGRALWRRATGRDGHEPRLHLVKADEAPEDADLVVAATGYRARTVPVFDRNGRRLALRAERGGAAADGSCRLALASGEGLAPLFVIGMASGYLPSEAGDGERSFRGSTNGAWLYRHATGARVFAGVAAAAGM
jgi:Pyridine nucleotide-disulphide oxidoreductase